MFMRIRSHLYNHSWAADAPHDFLQITENNTIKVHIFYSFHVKTLYGVVSTFYNVLSLSD